MYVIFVENSGKKQVTKEYAHIFFNQMPIYIE